MASSAASIALQLQQLTNQATDKTFEYNSREANTARQWQTEMSNTAHLREVEDLKKAGLNPVLASNNGAQSYTTSSASAQAENAANPVANVWSSQIGADATRAAAAQAAAATRYAAAASLAAARESASAQRYAADKHYDAQKYAVDHSKTGAAINIFKSAIQAGKNNISQAAYKASINNIKSMAQNRDQFMTDPNNKASAAFLNKAGKLRATREFNKYGIANTFANRDIFAKAYLDNDPKAMQKWINLINANLKAAENASKRGIKVNK